MFPIFRVFYYKITDPFYSESIHVDVNECSSVFDLKKIIASIWNYSDSLLLINNPPEENILKKLEEHYIFDITIQNRCKNITFYFPDDQIIKIQNGYRKRYDEIIKIFRKNNLYYSKKCVNHIHFFICDEEMPRKEFPFLAVLKGSIIDVKMSCDAIVLTYDEIKFIFCENESANKAYKLIQKVFKGYHSISIFNNNNKKLDYTDELNRYETYNIQVIYVFTFNNVETDSKLIQNLDLFTTVFDAQNSLAKFYKKNPEEIILFDENMNVINNIDELLINLHPVDQVFDFIVENNNFSSFFNEELEMKLKNYPKTPDKKPTNYTIDLDIILKQPVYPRTPEIKYKHKIRQNGDLFENEADFENGSDFPVTKKAREKELNLNHHEDILEKETDFENLPFFSKNKETKIESDLSHLKSSLRKESDLENVLNFSTNKKAKESNLNHHKSSIKKETFLEDASNFSVSKKANDIKSNFQHRKKLIKKEPDDEFNSDLRNDKNDQKPKSSHSGLKRHKKHTDYDILNNNQRINYKTDHIRSVKSIYDDEFNEDKIDSHDSKKKRNSNQILSKSKNDKKSKIEMKNDHHQPSKDKKQQRQIKKEKNSKEIDSNDDNDKLKKKIRKSSYNPKKDALKDDKNEIRIKIKVQPKEVEEQIHKKEKLCNKTEVRIKDMKNIIEEEEEEYSSKSEDEQANSKSLINIYDEFYEKEDEKINSSFRINLNQSDKENKHSSFLSNLIFEEEEECNEEDNNEKNVIKKESSSYSNRKDKYPSEDDASEIEMNSSDRDNISDIYSNHLTLTPNCDSMNISELQSYEIIEEEEETE